MKCKNCYIIFDRNNPQKAINKKIEQPNDSPSAWTWIIGGAVVLGIMALFSKNDD
jgi:hypothetical protein